MSCMPTVPSLRHKNRAVWCTRYSVCPLRAFRCSISYRHSWSALLLTPKIKDSASMVLIIWQTSMKCFHPSFFRSAKVPVKGQTGPCVTMIKFLNYRNINIHVKVARESSRAVNSCMERASIPIHVNGSYWAAILADGITDLFKKLLKLSCKYHVNDHSWGCSKIMSWLHWLANAPQQHTQPQNIH